MSQYLFSKLFMFLFIVIVIDVEYDSLLAMNVFDFITMYMIEFVLKLLKYWSWVSISTLKVDFTSRNLEVLIKHSSIIYYLVNIINTISNIALDHTFLNNIIDCWL